MPSATNAKRLRSAVIVAHDFLGLRNIQLEVARRLARHGYAVLAADFYGQDRRPADEEEATAMAAQVRADSAGTRRVMSAAYTALISIDGVDAERVVALGYSVGGVAAMELARTGLPLAGVIGLWPVWDDGPETIATDILMIAGDQDPLLPAATVARMRTALRQQASAHEIVVLPGVAHAFTILEAGTDPATGFAYDADADADAWERTLRFLKRVAPVASVGSP